MKSTLLLNALLAACFAFVASCGEKSAEEAADDAADESIELMEEYAEVMEGITDKDSAEAAIGKLDGLISKFKEAAASAKEASEKEMTPEEEQKIASEMEAKMKPIIERVTTASTKAMAVISQHPEVMQKFMTKMQEIGEASTAAMK